MRSTVDSSSSGATTRFTSPMRAASSAPIRSPVYRIMRACAGQHSDTPRLTRGEVVENLGQTRHISTDTALRFSGWLNVTTPIPSRLAARILPPAYSRVGASETGCIVPVRYYGAQLVVGR